MMLFSQGVLAKPTPHRLSTLIPTHLQNTTWWVIVAHTENVIKSQTQHFSVSLGFCRHVGISRAINKTSNQTQFILNTSVWRNHRISLDNVIFSLHGEGTLSCSPLRETMSGFYYKPEHIQPSLEQAGVQMTHGKWSPDLWPAVVSRDGGTDEVFGEDIFLNCKMARIIRHVMDIKGAIFWGTDKCSTKKPNLKLKCS